MPVAKIRERGQITIPKQIRESLGLKKGMSWMHGLRVIVW